MTKYLSILQTRSILKAIFDILNIVHNLARLYADERDAPDVQILEKDFRRSNEFIGTTLEIIARKGGFPWCKCVFLLDEKEYV